MPSLEIKIKDDLKVAMLAKEELVLSVLRMLLSSMQNKEISLRKDGAAELNDEQILAVIKTEVKKRKDSIESYTTGGREDLAKEIVGMALTDEDMVTVIRRKYIALLKRLRRRK